MFLNTGHVCGGLPAYALGFRGLLFAGAGAQPFDARREPRQHAVHLRRFGFGIPADLIGLKNALADGLRAGGEVRSTFFHHQVREYSGQYREIEPGP